MIYLSTLRDEKMVIRRGRGVGKLSRRHTAIGVDNRNIIIAEGSTDKPIGKVWFGCLDHLSKALAEWEGIDVEEARKQICTLLCRVFGGESTNKLTWAEMDNRFSISKREKGSSAKLTLYRRLKEAGFQGGDDDDETDSA